MTRAALPLLAAFLSPLVLASAPPAGTSQFRAELNSQGPERLVVRDIVWRCGAGACVAPSGNSRPVVACAALAREAGPLRSFTAEGRALSGEDLEKCNARARQ